MHNTLSLVKDVRGCMTRFDSLTPEIVADQTEDGLTYNELKEVLEECEMDIGKEFLTAPEPSRTPFMLTSSKVITAGYRSRRKA